MTEILYMKDIDSCYIKVFDAKVINVDRGNGTTVIFDRTAFYPTGGGQPCDSGVLEWDNGEAIVKEVSKKNRVIHHIEGDVPDEGIQIHGALNWDRRYKHMRMHTAQHIVSAVVWNEYHASTVGNQIHDDNSHIDFCPSVIREEEVGFIEKEVNKIIEASHPVWIEQRSRSDIESKLKSERVDLSRLPAFIKMLRTVLIGSDGEIDLCPCAGTHVKNTKELGTFRITKRRSKGSKTVRIQYKLV